MWVLHVEHQCLLLLLCLLLCPIGPNKQARQRYCNWLLPDVRFLGCSRHRSATPWREMQGVGQQHPLLLQLPPLCCHACLRQGIWADMQVVEIPAPQVNNAATASTAAASATSLGPAS